MLGVPTASAADSPVASFDYTMPDRFGLDENDDGLTDYVAGTTDRPGPVEVDPGQLARRPRRLRQHRRRHAPLACDRPARPGDPLTVTQDGDGCDDFDLDVPVEGTYRVELTATEDGVSTITTLPVVVQDWLIVSLGDSYGSGEGVPDIEIPQDEYEEFLAAWRDFDTKLRRRRHDRGRPRAVPPAGGAVA